jgi:hypothetical protein
MAQFVSSRNLAFVLNWLQEKRFDNPRGRANWGNRLIQCNF